MQESHKRIQWVYESNSDQELAERYDQWAADYDIDLAEVFVWVAPEIATNVFAKLSPTAGCDDSLRFCNSSITRNCERPPERAKTCWGTESTDTSALRMCSAQSR